ncbi:MAG: hypothetical protein HC822_05550 [Oscillochloris sp.]|nr:hypothetical protein [Oscillochloris sp.]
MAPSELLAGALYPFRALALINRNRRIWRFILVPIGVNIVVGIALYAGLFLSLRAWVLGLLEPAAAPWLAGFLTFLITLILVIGLPLGIAWLLVRFGVVLGSPWYGQLSEHLESQLRGSPPPSSPLTTQSVAYDIWRALGFELKKLALTISIGVPVLLLNLIPVAGQVLAISGGISLGIVITCLDFFDSPLERRRITFRSKLALIRRSVPASIGFGLVALGLISIPLINLLAIPLCVTAGTLFVIERLPDVLEQATPNRQPETAEQGEE